MFGLREPMKENVICEICEVAENLCRRINSEVVFKFIEPQAEWMVAKIVNFDGLNNVLLYGWMNGEMLYAEYVANVDDVISKICELTEIHLYLNINDKTKVIMG